MDTSHDRAAPALSTGAPTVTRADGRHERDQETRGDRAGLPFWVEFPLLLLIAFGIAFVIKAFLVQAFYIPSGSMEQTLQVGDRVLVNKLVYRTRPIERGDVVVFDGSGVFSPEFRASGPDNPVQAALQEVARAIGVAAPDERDFIKRVIGVGGDRVRCCDDAGRITVNGVPLDEESYLYPGDAPSEEEFDVLVPDGALWVMGDHRSASSDSRSHLGDPGGGFVPVDAVLGRAFTVVWPVDSWQVLPIPDTFGQPALAGGGA